MFTSRNIHFAILGIILGATSGYILAFYQVQQSMPAPVQARSQQSASQQQQQQPPGQPDVTTEQLLALFENAMAKNPNNPELLTRYGTFLVDIGRRAEAEKMLKQVEAIDPKYAGLDALRKRIAAERGTKAP
jgi:tetratricopeptide (TPR) repeat protein